MCELDLAHCSLESVPSDIFAYERTLERLHLECNNIRDLPRELFNCQGGCMINFSVPSILSLWIISYM